MGEQGDILIEQRRLGSYLRVAAVCAVSGLEVTFVAPADAGQALINALAASKLARARARAQNAVEPPPPAHIARGVVV